jgi:hypothetical protein
MVTKLLEAPITQHCRQHHASLCLAEDMIHNITFKANWALKQKRKQEIIDKSDQKENKNQIPYGCKVGDQVLLKRPRTLQKLSTSYTRAISCNECIQEWFNQNPKHDLVIK